ncbi:S41 family peptidase [Pedobacter gandavensis]|uniref:S41 family peptidase n=1 Tax=Pedobacter gandavensis TaxID=2679963 RepID=UPI002930BAA1|nr:S41 family peptidase [Pedobacter gandavensis]
MYRTGLPFLFLILASTFTVGYAQKSVNDTLLAQALRDKIQKGQAETSNYNMACYFALSGDHAFAFSCLKKAISNDDFSNITGIEKDTDLLSLHNDPEWKVILQDVKNNALKKEKLDKTFINQAGFWDSKALKTPYQENISADEKVAGLSKFWSEAKYNFVNFDLVPDLNFDSLYLAYLPKVKSTKSTAEYYKLMTEFCAHLKDGHTNVMVPKELINEFYGRPLLRTRLIEDRVIVIAVYDPTLGKKGIKVGQEVITVDGLPVKEYARRYVIPYQSASTLQNQNSLAYDFSLFDGAVNKPVELELRDEKGVTKKHSVSRVNTAERWKYMATAPFEFKMLKGNIALISLNSFGTDSAARAFATRYPEISKANAIIFDVRNNGGGDSSVGWEILGYLTKNTEPIHSWYTRAYKPSYRAWGITQGFFGRNSFLKPNEKFFYDKPVVVLTSARSFSAAEDFAGAFKSLNRGLIIGEASGGSSGQPLIISLPGNLSARICTKRDMLGNGEDFVGKGVQPDKLVIPTIADFRKGVDTELAVAIKELTR